MTAVEVSGIQDSERPPQRRTLTVYLWSLRLNIQANNSNVYVANLDKNIDNKASDGARQK